MENLFGESSPANHVLSIIVGGGGVKCKIKFPDSVRGRHFPPLMVDLKLFLVEAKIFRHLHSFVRPFVHSYFGKKALISFFFCFLQQIFTRLVVMTAIAKCPVKQLNTDPACPTVLFLAKTSPYV